eukprot:TRINITY_DN732_c0_g1_i2.p1 TRINITY_DN732_c0_g1~~TRINITY_DN732_c0_g1_i2.p1  ORF type:complete len:352 (+),score=117.87 TRINITY_DN732_c0_g1_i2:94-1149(+)
MGKGARKEGSDQPAKPALPVGGGKPQTAFGRWAKTVFDPVLTPLVEFSWVLGSLFLTAITVAGFFVVGEAINAVYPSGTPGTALSPVYDGFRGYVFPEWASHPLYPSLISTVQMWGMAAIFTVIDFALPSWAAEKRIQQGRAAGEFPPLGLWEAVRHTASLYMYLVPVFVYQYLFRGPSLYGAPWAEPCFEDCGDLPDAAPALGEFALHVAASFVMFDMGYWYWHWMHHHHRPLWMNVHRCHHQYNSPFAFCSQYLHPLEFLATGVFSILPSVALKAHPFTVWVNIMIGVWLSVDAHSGYDFFPIDRLSFGLLGGTFHHDEHHRKPTSNFQPFMTYLEHLSGTSSAKPAKK